MPFWHFYSFLSQTMETSGPDTVFKFQPAVTYIQILVFERPRKQEYGDERPWLNTIFCHDWYVVTCKHFPELQLPWVSFSFMLHTVLFVLVFSGLPKFSSPINTLELISLRHKITDFSSWYWKGSNNGFLLIIHCHTCSYPSFNCLHFIDPQTKFEQPEASSRNVRVANGGRTFALGFIRTPAVC